jgi:hypothetical protein
MALGLATIWHTLWVRHLLKNILNIYFVGILHCKNQEAVRVATDDTSNKRTRNTYRDFYITNEALFKKMIELKWVRTIHQLAKIFTKSLGPEVFQRLKESLVLAQE